MQLMVMKKKDNLTAEEIEAIAAAISGVDQALGNGGHRVFLAGIVKVSTFNGNEILPARYFRNAKVISWETEPDHPITRTKVAAAIRQLVRSGLLGQVDWAISDERIAAGT